MDIDGFWPFYRGKPVDFCGLVKTKMIIFASAVVVVKMGERASTKCHKRKAGRQKKSKRTEKRRKIKIMAS